MNMFERKAPEMTNEHRKALEDRYILDFERSMAVRARRNTLLAKWLGQLTGRNDTQAYVERIMATGLAEAGDEALCEQILSDLKNWGKTPSGADLRDKMHALTLDAAEQLATEAGSGTAA